MHSNYLYFLFIPLPPSNWNLREAEKKAKNEKNEVFRRWDIEKVEKKELSKNPSTTVMMVHKETLKKKVEPFNLIEITYPCLCVLGGKWPFNLKECGGFPQFAFGGYKDVTHLFYLEDVLDWSHHRRAWKEVRDAMDISRELKRGK